MTKSCRLVLQVLENTDRLLTAQDIYDKLRESQQGRPPGLTTVYRSLEQLIKANSINVINSQEGERRYSCASKSDNHLHHIICKHCYRSLPIEQCTVEKMAKEVAKENGFMLESHIVEFYGVCPDCLESQNIKTDQMDSKTKKKEKQRALVTADS